MDGESNLKEYFEWVKRVESEGASSRDDDPPKQKEDEAQEENNGGDDGEEESAALEDEESAFRFFLSEPSISEGDGTTDSAERERILSLLTSGQPRPPPENSPGNTSLSSKDSSQFGLQKMVHVHFTSEQRRRLRLPQLAPPPDLQMHSSQAESSNGNKQEAYDLSARKLASTQNTSEASGSIGITPSMEQRATDFLQDLKEHSIGAVKDAQPDDFDSDHKLNVADENEVDAVMRHGERGERERSYSVETDKMDNITPGDADETLAMMLSETDDDDDEVRTKDTEATPLDWEQKHSADDEQTTEAKQPRRRRFPLGRFPRGHRRTRSGDAAAASLMTGGTDWRGMQVDQIPIPPPHDELDEDEESHDHKYHQHRRRNSADPTASSLDWKGQMKRAPAPSPHAGGDNGSTGADQQLGRSNADTKPHLAYLEKQHRTVEPMGGQWEKKGDFSRVRNPRDDFELRQASSELTPDTFSGLALESEEATTGDGVSSYGDSFSAQDYYPADQNGDSFRLPTATLAQEGSVAARGHARRSSDMTISTRDSIPSATMTNQYPNEGRYPTMASQYENQYGKDRYPAATNQYPSDGRYPIRGERPSETSEMYDDNDSDSYYSTSEESERDIMSNRMEYPAGSLQGLPEAEHLLENREFRGNAQNVLRHPALSPFANLRKGEPKTPLNTYRFDSPSGRNDLPTFQCPKCQTIQREFYTVATLPSQFESPAGYLALYFAIYVVAALYIFGLEEGWAPLDCVYFAVITLTTAGLGDLVPTSDGAKIICSIFIYIGVACIGLLLGTFLSGMMDDKSIEDAKKQRVENCTNCARLRDAKRTLKRQKSLRRSTRDSSGRRASVSTMGGKHWISERHLNVHGPDSFNGSGMGSISQSMRVPHSLPGLLGSISEDSNVSASKHVSKRRPEPENADFRTPTAPEDRKGSDRQPLEVIDGYSPGQQQQRTASSVLGSPMTSQILHRQRRTRHTSIGHDNPSAFFGTGSGVKPRKYSEEIAQSPISPAIPEGEAVEMGRDAESWRDNDEEDSSTETDSDEEASMESSTSSSLAEEVYVLATPESVKTARYIFLTLKQALMNSLLIIAIGGIGFTTIEKMTMVDAFYFTTVLLTTVGYGDIVPVTSAGKLFSTVYVLVAGTVLLNNMSLISMIPLELRRRRLERAVLTQFGDQLDDLTLRELATGPLVRRLQLAHRNQWGGVGLNECTREMFALAMLVRLGKVTESDIRMTFAAFRRLDVDNDGLLSSKSIIAGMMAAKRREAQMRNTPVPGVTQPAPPAPFARPGGGGIIQSYYYGQEGSLHIDTAQGELRYQAAPPSHRRSFSHSPRFRGTPSEVSALYGSGVAAYDSFPQAQRGGDVEQGYDEDDFGDQRLSSSLK